MGLIVNQKEKRPSNTGANKSSTIYCKGVMLLFLFRQRKGYFSAFAKLAFQFHMSFME